MDRHTPDTFIGVYRFWRDLGFVLGALIAGVAADLASSETAILIVTALTAASGFAVLGTRWQTQPTLRPTGEVSGPPSACQRPTSKTDLEADDLVRPNNVDGA